MKILDRFSLVLLIVGVVAAAESAYAQQPPDVVKSDAFQNTAMGTRALLNLTPGAGQIGYFNTAAGYQALYSNTIGNANTATGVGALYTNTTSCCNTANGYSALYFNTTGSANTAFGYGALFDNTTGYNNAASGTAALNSNTTGYENTATGNSALFSNTTGNSNAASGNYALLLNTIGSYNTASGTSALENNTTGSDNTASGYKSLNANTTANYNTATGAYALAAATGCCNTATGNNALLNDTTGNNNTAEGNAVLYTNTTGYNNTAVGESALYHNSTGATNIALGYYAGSNLSTGSFNIEIGNRGAAADHGTIRVGTSGQQVKTFIAGINNSKVTGAGVIVDPSTGQLGVLASSERFKTGIAPMGSNTERLEKLRPVTFHLKGDSKRVLQYGLLAEEVAKIYPELVIRDESGSIDGVRYDELAPMLLNEAQQQAAQIRDLKKLVDEMHAELRNLQAKEGAAQR